MTNLNEIYKCSVCGNIVSVLHAAAGELVCCGQAMNKLAENSEDAATEKHVPIVKATDSEIEVSVGEVEHPMTDDHYIEWIEVISDNKSYFQHLQPGDQPVAIFPLKKYDKVRAYCNLHGLWKNK